MSEKTKHVAVGPPSMLVFYAENYLGYIYRPAKESPRGSQWDHRTRERINGVFAELAKKNFPRSATTFVLGQPSEFKKHFIGSKYPGSEPSRRDYIRNRFARPSPDKYVIEAVRHQILCPVQYYREERSK